MHGVRKNIIVLPDVHTGNETGFSTKSRRNILVRGVELDLPRTVFPEELVSRACQMLSIIQLGFAGNSLSIDLPIPVELELRINTAYAIEPDFALRNGAKAIR